MLYSIVRFFYPGLRDEEVRKFGLLSITFFFTIGAYWMFRLLKDTVFFAIAFPSSLGWASGQGALFQPTAKKYSVLVVVLCVLIYSKLVDWFEKHKLFYIICSFYAAIFAAITTVLVIREFYGDAAIGKGLLALTGWVTYFGVESFGSISIPLFWSFVISVTDSESAKTGFPLIIAGAQFGSIGCSALTIYAEELGGVWKLFLIGTSFVLVIMGLIYYFMKTTPESQLVGNKAAAETEKKKEGFIEGFIAGIRLLFTRPYLLGVLVVSTFYEVVGTIVDYQMKRQAYAIPEYASETGFAKFLGIFGVCVNSLAFFMALLGTSYLMKKLGLKFCLLVYPVCFGISLSALYLLYSYGHPTASMLLWATFGVMMIVKGLSYAVNNPTKEMMYIPTSKDVKYKTKGWIDMFGGRTAKMGGAQVTDALKADMALLMTYGTILGLGLIGVWIVAAVFVGNKFNKLTRENKIIQ